MHKDFIIHKIPPARSVTNTTYLFLHRIILQAYPAPGTGNTAMSKAERAPSLSRLLSCEGRQTNHQTYPVRAIWLFWCDRKFWRRGLNEEEKSPSSPTQWEGTGHTKTTSIPNRISSTKVEARVRIFSDFPLRDGTRLLRGFGAEAGELHSCSQLSCILTVLPSLQLFP